MSRCAGFEGTAAILVAVVMLAAIAAWWWYLRADPMVPPALPGAAEAGSVVYGGHAAAGWPMCLPPETPAPALRW